MDWQLCYSTTVGIDLILVQSVFHKIYNEAMFLYDGDANNAAYSFVRASLDEVHKVAHVLSINHISGYFDSIDVDRFNAARFLD